MNYVYDIVLNFNYPLYDIFDWNITDDLLCIKKIPIFEIKKRSFYELCNTMVKMDKSFLDMIKLKTELFSKKNTQCIEYACLFKCEEEVFGCLFDRSGYSIGKSYLLFDEEEEILNYSTNDINMHVNYTVIKKDNKNLYKTRNQIEMDIYIRNEINSFFDNIEYNKIRYLYYECFDEKIDINDDNISQIKRKMFNSLDEISFKIYNFLKKCSLK